MLAPAPPEEEGEKDVNIGSIADFEKTLQNLQHAQRDLVEAKRMLTDPVTRYSTPIYIYCAAYVCFCFCSFNIYYIVNGAFF
jgi:hypothetical protein